MPAASSAAATVSSGQARTDRPSTVRVTVSPAMSGSRWNMEPLGAEGREVVGRQPTSSDMWRDHERVVGRQGHAAMAGGEEGARTALRLVVNRKAVQGHDPQRRPGADDTEP